ncbi:hypothetical protein CQU01_17680 [Cerasibacillus quisquiliarum]|uniref:Uncharacterized protein n=1 Tax=Cerasibacillus quisquiliarum TaxID=227865 RepID=A0A511UY29_9BACI|nr:hypothetical protein CQU01_17680 [Cerasibacillus quisquiliarum]
MNHTGDKFYIMCEYKIYLIKGCYVHIESLCIIKKKITILFDEQSIPCNNEYVIRINVNKKC